MSRYPYIDRNPCILAAGKPIGDPYETIKGVFQDITPQDKVEALRKQFGFIDTKSYGEELVKPPNQDVSGAFTEIRHCLRPPLPTRFQAFDEEIKCTIYDSYWNKALGKTRDQTPGLPAGLNPEEKIMGKPTDRSVTAGEVINPRKSQKEVFDEEKQYHDLYAFTHRNYYPGEQIKQCYKPPFNHLNVFGKSSNKDESSSRVKKSLTWFNNDPLCHVSRRQAAVRNRTLPSLGQGLDKTGVAEMFPEDHTFGKPTAGDFYGVEDLLNECTPSLLRRDMLVFLSYANSLRQTVFKKINEGDFCLEELYEEILGVIKDSENPDCSVNFDCIDKIMKRHRIYLDRSKIEPLLIILGIISQDGKIKVRDFITVIDKNARFPQIKQEHFILPPEFQACGYKFKCELRYPEDNNRIQSIPAGSPTVRLDKPYPIYVDSLTNMDHLGQETTARSLLSPSIYTQYGLSHRDFLLPRSKEFLANLFRKINVDLSDEDLDEIYQEGYELDKTGGVCVETFRNILDQRAYNAYMKII